MTDYRIFETRRFTQDLKKIVEGSLPRLKDKLREYVYPLLRKEPHFGLHIKRLKGWEHPTWRYRIADWRFFYEIDEKKKIVFMTVAEHRSQAY